MHVPLLALLLAGTTMWPVLATGGISTNHSKYASLLAPVYREAEAGDVWVYPNSSFDLGARAMSCECFDPSGTPPLLKTCPGPR